ncbi:hypothetical protein PLANPX_5149 [Lacipirellula parvula]|uniref:Uncharacterized protein n=1 Tax=Lacipirellula parvula TaxID=2650471 RepID=A0A5K7XHS6_9BACT|nr:hypothetical protein PLANPX_5149 [Lacipirellula parvula]
MLDVLDPASTEQELKRRRHAMRACRRLIASTSQYPREGANVKSSSAPVP